VAQVSLYLVHVRACHSIRETARPRLRALRMSKIN